MCTTLRIDMSATGSNISRLRKEKGISIRQIQEVMGFNTPQAIFKWQRGESLPALDNMIILSDLLETPIEKIVVVTK